MLITEKVASQQLLFWMTTQLWNLYVGKEESSLTISPLQGGLAVPGTLSCESRQLGTIDNNGRCAASKAGLSTHAWCHMIMIGTVHILKMVNSGGLCARFSFPFLCSRTFFFL